MITTLVMHRSFIIDVLFIFNPSGRSNVYSHNISFSICFYDKLMIFTLLTTEQWNLYHFHECVWSQVSSCTYKYSRQSTYFIFSQISFFLSIFLSIVGGHILYFDRVAFTFKNVSDTACFDNKLFHTKKTFFLLQFLFF